MSDDRKAHWDNVYDTKQPHEVSWTQEQPEAFLKYIHSLNLPKSASIIDIGGGDSKLVDCLLDNGFEHITVLDISEAALKRAQVRLGDKANKVKWIVSDIIHFEPEQQYDIWHDRATFHFLTTPAQIDQYIKIAHKAVKEYLVISTFSDKGPETCSGLQVKQYSEDELHKKLSKGFTKIKCITEDHITPFNTIQNFLCCSFKKL